ncbi:MAG: hypothetical protein GDA68_21810, partial [Nitrospira sp. CR2.1]|nr:hypothetical protein [Nitrospira sp. CR2.1]
MNLILNMQVVDHTSSDHCCLSLDFRGFSRPLGRDVDRPWFPHPECNYALFAALFDDRLRSALDSLPALPVKACIDRTADLFSDTFSELLPCFFVHSLPKEVAPSPLTELIKKLQRLHRKLCKSQSRDFSPTVAVKTRTLSALLKKMRIACYKHSRLREMESCVTGRQVRWKDILRLVPSQVDCHTKPINVSDFAGLPPSSTRQSLSNLALAFCRYSDIPPSSDADLSRNVRSFVDELQHVAINDVQPVSIAEVQDALKALNSSMLSSSDGIPEQIFKAVGAHAQRVLADLFSLSLQNAYIPSLWKRAFVRPLHKQGLTTDANNWRPVSSSHPLLKCLERIVEARHYNVLSRSIHPNQAGFVRGRSMLEQLVVLSDARQHVVSHRSYKPVVFIDLLKAYDRCWRDGLLYMMWRKGLPLSLIRWFHSLLTNRSYVVVYNGFASDAYCPSNGLPQGGVLSCIMFSFFYSDVASAHPRGYTGLNADDTLHLPSTHGRVSLQDVEAAIPAIDAYLSRWCLEPNPAKSCFLFIRAANVVPPSDWAPTLRGVLIRRVREKKYIGILCDERLTFKKHADKTRASVSAEARFLRRHLSPFSLGITPPPALLLALIRTRLCNRAYYGAEFWLSDKPSHQKDFDRSIALTINLLLKRSSANLSSRAVLLAAAINPAFIEVEGRSLSLASRILQFESTSTAPQVILSLELKSLDPRFVVPPVVAAIPPELLPPPRVPSPRSFSARVSFLARLWKVSLLDVSKSTIRSLKKEEALSDFVESGKPVRFREFAEGLSSAYYLFSDGDDAMIRSAFRFGYVNCPSRLHTLYPHKYPNPSCSFCPGAEGSISHLLLDCPRFYRERLALFNLLQELPVPLNLNTLMGVVR